MNVINLFKTEKTEKGTLLNSTNDSVEPYVYHVLKYGEDAFNSIGCNQFDTYYPDEEGDEGDWAGEQEGLFKSSYCCGNKEMLEIFNQECVICFEKPNVYAFRHCGHQSICETCSQNKGDIDI